MHGGRLRTSADNRGNETVILKGEAELEVEIGIRD
jgi:hypothetical protein